MFLSNSTDLNMFSLKNMPSTAAVFSAYTTLMAVGMVIQTMATQVKTIFSQIIPKQLQEKIISRLGRLFDNPSSTVLTLQIDQYNETSDRLNQIYEASEIYLRSKIDSKNPSSFERLLVSRSLQEKKLSVTMGKREELIDVFEGIELRWKCMSTKSDQSPGGPGRTERRSFELSFPKKHMATVLNTYLPDLESKSEALKEGNKAVKLYDHGGGRGSIRLHHPPSFETLAMDPVLKKQLKDDLDRFLSKREFYRRIGKPWKRGYLLYGPPGTGKSSLIAAIADYLKFHIYDLELTNLKSNSSLKNLLLSTANKSILVIEDIDCTVELQDRQELGTKNNGDSRLTLSGLLNFIDGLWSSSGDARIIIFTTNHKDRIDPALLRPGRMDMHIHMSYCTPSSFNQLASIYLDIANHRSFKYIEELITEVDVTPAEVAEELLKSDDPDVALVGLITFLQRKKMERNESHAEGGNEDKGQYNI
ncbi:hypothetical protein HHK36_010172 [Tetracentron sinense]|uniref:AAA+ ATPase domain-containing protein n=1 Tax=Tetracentron sinense TaxID=13715 RepID=A0A835DJ10_TETSI|nr:hypothetical protein HHK36_010172 [Tetracentron sinense]